MPFLLDLFRIPADTFQLFLATGVINSRVGSLVAAVHTLTVALLATCAVTGRLRWQRGKVISYAGITVALVIGVLGSTRLLFATTLSPPYSKDAVLAGMELLSDPVDVTVSSTPSPAPPTELPPLEAIQARKVLRVGYLPDALPFAFVNQRGDLVGFDAELAHQLARDLGVSLAFVAVDRQRMPQQLADGYCDLVMSGVAVTTDRARDLLLSDSYLDETVALVMADHRRDEFTRWATIGTRGPLTIAVPDLPYYVSKLRALLPGATITITHDVAAWFAAPDTDALALPAERGSAWTLRYPAFSVVVPGPDPIKVPLAYPIGRRDEPMARLVNTWLALKRKDGTHRRGVPALDSRARCGAGSTAMVDRARRASLGGVIMADTPHHPRLEQHPSAGDDEDRGAARRAALSPILGSDDFRPAASSVRVTVGARSHQGQLRQRNEDHYIPNPGARVAPISPERHV